MKPPYVEQALIDYLNLIYPDRCPSLKLSDREVWWASGERNVVRHIISLMEAQNEQAAQQKVFSSNNAS